MSVLKNKHILIICAGSSIVTYRKKIKKFIKQNNVVTFGCNNISHVFIPDYHVWSDSRRYEMFGGNTSKKSKVILGRAIEYKLRKKHKKVIKKFDVVDFNALRVKMLPIHFNTIGCLLMLFLHKKKVGKISVVGMDGYTFYTKEELDNRSGLQHCYDSGIKELPKEYGKFINTGYTDVINKYDEDGIYENKKRNRDIFYKYCKNKDKNVHNTMIELNKYGIKFEILTPTVYTDFYNPRILKIERGI